VLNTLFTTLGGKITKREYYFKKKKKKIILNKNPKNSNFGFKILNP
jgi:hypothetical protein